MMIKTDNKPYSIFRYDNGKTVAHSKEVQREILSNKAKKMTFKARNNEKK